MFVFYWSFSQIRSPRKNQQLLFERLRLLKIIFQLRDQKARYKYFA